MITLIRLTLVVFIIAGCDATVDASRLDNNLADTSWLFERAETGDGTVDHEPTNSRRAAIYFGDRLDNEDGYSVSGYNGCNSFSGKYSVDGTEIVFSELLQTLRACQEQEARIESAFSRGIVGARSFTLEDNNLVIDAPGESVKLRLIREVVEE